jgi:hypothetical protein
MRNNRGKGKNKKKRNKTEKKKIASKKYCRIRDICLNKFAFD